MKKQVCLWWVFLSNVINEPVKTTKVYGYLTPKQLPEFLCHKYSRKKGFWCYSNWFETVDPIMLRLASIQQCTCWVECRSNAYKLTTAFLSISSSFFISSRRTSVSFPIPVLPMFEQENISLPTLCTKPSASSTYSYDLKKGLRNSYNNFVNILPTSIELIHSLAQFNIKSILCGDY